ncbi:hypothetical protein C8R43DRAFT_1111136 [Mycena crocata]|nr:hypothetical protein C8R43DRAFT_1111136 [Mycena crocata]
MATTPLTRMLASAAPFTSRISASIERMLPTPLARRTAATAATGVALLVTSVLGIVAISRGRKASPEPATVAEKYEAAPTSVSEAVKTAAHTRKSEQQQQVRTAGPLLIREKVDAKPRPPVAHPPIYMMSKADQLALLTNAGFERLLENQNDTRQALGAFKDEVKSDLDDAKQELVLLKKELRSDYAELKKELKTLVKKVETELLEKDLDSEPEKRKG